VAVGGGPTVVPIVVSITTTRLVSKLASAPVMQEKCSCTCLSTGLIVGISVAVAIVSAVLSSFLTYFTIARRYSHYVRNRDVLFSTEKDEKQNVEMAISRPSGSAEYEDIDNNHSSSHAHVLQDTMTVSALYSSVIAGDAGDLDDRSMQTNPAYGHVVSS
jgi:hypothetical protein